MSELTVDTPGGPALVVLDRAPRARAVLALGHGAGGGIEAPDLLAVRAACLAAGITVARIVQPYRVAGRRAPAPAPRLDEAWCVTVTALRRQRGLGALPLIVGGRSSGARVACRTAADVGAAGVVTLAFPLHPPGKPEATREPELAQPVVPVLVVQGDRDPFGMPPAGAGRRVLVVAGADHGLKKDLAGTGRAVVEFIDGLL